MSYFFKIYFLLILFISTTQIYAKTSAEAIDTITNYANHSTGKAPTVMDYSNAGVLRVNSSNIDGVNAKINVLLSVEVDTKSEIQIVVDDYNQMIAAVLTIITQHILSEEPFYVEAGNMQVKESSNLITLDGSASRGVESYSWSFTSSSPTGVSVTLNQANSAVSTFTAPVVTEPTTLVFTLQVTYTNGATTTDTVTVVVKPESPRLLINEISGAVYTNSDRWLELYNPTGIDVDLSLFTLKSLAFDGQSHSIFTFALPSKIIPPKGYLVIRPDYSAAYNTTLPVVENSQVIYLKDSTSAKYPTWYSDDNSAIELLKEGKTIDYVRLGDDSGSPTTAGEWSGAGLPHFGTAATAFWQSIARDIFSTDTHTANDWMIRSFPTYAAINDVTCDDDADADGIPDCSEVNGSTYAGMDLYAYGARINQKDMFIEVDYMDSTDNGTRTLDEGVVPRQEALEKVKNVFATHGYSLHFDVGDLFAQDGNATNPAQMDLGGGDEIPYAQTVNFNSGTDMHDYKAEHMKPHRKSIFHYMLFGTSQEVSGVAGSSGLAEGPGNDVLITLGSWGLSSDTAAHKNALINFQAATVMHEFGHNLGLLHGGDENNNYKPNYLSVMNYLYQLDGLPTIGDNEGDRYYHNRFHGNNSCDNTALTNPYNGNTDDFKIDYSDGSSDNLIETGVISESNGLYRDNSNPVDFNCNGVSNNILYQYDVNGNSTKETLHDYDDWAHIITVFARTYDGNMGTSSSKNSKTAIRVNPLANDMQPAVKEFAFRPK